jgi:hypothetical protein
MNKKIILICIAAIISLTTIAAATIYSLNREENTDKPETRSNSIEYKSIAACDLLTLDEAKTLLGANAVQTLREGPDSGVNESMSQCSYSNNETDLALMRVIHISARSPLTRDGINGNTSAFESTNGSTPAAGDEVVEGYGDKARWDTSTHQLAILKDNTWLRISYGGSNQTTNTIEDAKKVADIILSKRLQY